MAKVGFPAIQAPGSVELRSLQQLADNIRERFLALENLANATQRALAATQNAAQSANVQAQLDNLQQQISTLQGSAAIDVLESLLANQPNGLVVLANGALITRVLRAGENIVIVNGDGVAGDPIIATHFTEATPFVQEGWNWLDSAEDEVVE